MEEFFDLGGSTGIVELHVAAEIIGVSMVELRLSDNYLPIVDDILRYYSEQDTTPNYPNNGYEDFEDEIYNHDNY